MEIKIFYDFAEEEKRKNHDLLPNSIRGVITGKSGSGKTVLLINLLLQPEWLDYNNLMIFGMSLHQKKYKILYEGFKHGLSKKQISDIFERQHEFIKNKIDVFDLIKCLTPKGKGEKIECHFYGKKEVPPDPNELDINKKNLIIFDDLMTESQKVSSNYYTRGRHNNVDCIYLTQNYFELPKRTIRDNANIFIFFKTDYKSMNSFYASHVSGDMELDEFKFLCRKAWEHPFGFIVIDKTSEINYGRYRVGFDNFFIPSQT